MRRRGEQLELVIGCFAVGDELARKLVSLRIWPCAEAQVLQLGEHGWRRTEVARVQVHLAVWALKEDEGCAGAVVGIEEGHTHTLDEVRSVKVERMHETARDAQARAHQVGGGERAVDRTGVKVPGEPTVMVRVVVPDG